MTQAKFDVDILTMRLRTVPTYSRVLEYNIPYAGISVYCICGRPVSGLTAGRHQVLQPYSTEQNQKSKKKKKKKKNRRKKIIQYHRPKREIPNYVQSYVS